MCELSEPKKKINPKDPAVLKILQRINFTIAILIHYLWRSPVNFPQEKQGVSETVP